MGLRKTILTQRRCLYIPVPRGSGGLLDTSPLFHSLTADTQRSKKTNTIVVFEVTVTIAFFNYKINRFDPALPSTTQLSTAVTTDRATFAITLRVRPATGFEVTP
ncbi:hypothetical protein E2C01_063635 [Portunus trituberculatus]|uniref:Uncharacterized protein n=1 Tax=Portunus trituberculatus TaxID=210409 RepID=A0A5B7H9N5_PORTR|nr:hypothetical protein [Portunus trituberculatus]